MAVVMKILLLKVHVKILKTLIFLRCEWKKQYFKINMLDLGRDSNMSGHISKLGLERDCVLVHLHP